MKITIAYTAEEEGNACAATRQLLRLFPAMKVHKSERHPPFLHLYMTTKIPEKPYDIRESTCNIP